MSLKMSEPLFFIHLGEGREIAVALTTRIRTSAATMEDMPPTAEDVIRAVRILQAGVLTDHRISTTSEIAAGLIP